MKMAFDDGFFGILARRRNPAALVPQHDRSSAIFSFGDGPFEIAIIERMIFGPHREALVCGVDAWPLGNGPAF